MSIHYVTRFVGLWLSLSVLAFGETSPLPGASAPMGGGFVTQWGPLLRPDDYVHQIPVVAPKGCTKPEMEKTQEFVVSREKLKKDGLISGRSLIYTHMLLIESLACSGEYTKEQYCTQQGLRLNQIEHIYRNSAVPDHRKLPLPGHHLQNLMALRSRCS